MGAKKMIIETTTEIKKEFEAIAGEELTLDIYGNTFIAIGSEIACLMLFALLHEFNGARFEKTDNGLFYFRMF